MKAICCFKKKNDHRYEYKNIDSSNELNERKIKSSDIKAEREKDSFKLLNSYQKPASREYINKSEKSLLSCSPNSIRQARKLKEFNLDDSSEEFETELQEKTKECEKLKLHNNELIQENKEIKRLKKLEIKELIKSLSEEQAKNKDLILQQQQLEKIIIEKNESINELEKKLESCLENMNETEAIKDNSNELISMISEISSELTKVKEKLKFQEETTIAETQKMQNEITFFKEKLKKRSLLKQAEENLVKMKNDLFECQKLNKTLKQENSILREKVFTDGMVDELQELKESLMEEKEKFEEYKTKFTIF